MLPISYFRGGMQLAKRCWAAINLDNICHNYKLFKSMVNANTQVIAVVKANAYGHGAVDISRQLSAIGCNYFAVATVLEAVELRKCGISSSILILGYTPPEQLHYLYEYNLIQTIYSIEYAKLVSDNISGNKILVHIKLDSGMARLGINTFDYNLALQQVCQITNINNFIVTGIYTHLASSCGTDDKSVNYTINQVERFIKVVNAVKAKGINVGIVHCSNSAAAINYKQFNFDAIRLGISLYGLSPTNSKIDVDIRAVMTYQAVITQVKTIQSNTCVGYGSTYVASKETKVATIALGYADGYPRLLSNKGTLSCKGVRVKVIGRVCMDQIMLDVSDIDVSLGDTVTIFGEGSDITCEEFAASVNTINYEITCDINSRVSRVFIKDGKIVNIIE